MARTSSHGYRMLPCSCAEGANKSGKRKHRVWTRSHRVGPGFPAGTFTKCLSCKQEHSYPPEATRTVENLSTPAPEAQEAPTMTRTRPETVRAMAHEAQPVQPAERRWSTTDLAMSVALELAMDVTGAQSLDGEENPKAYARDLANWAANWLAAYQPSESPCVGLRPAFQRACEQLLRVCDPRQPIERRERLAQLQAVTKSLRPYCQRSAEEADAA